MDMKISSDDIRAYVAAQTEIRRRTLPEENRRVILRLPVDSVDISPQARALAKGRLKVQTMEDGSYAAVTDNSSNPVMKLLDEGMSDVKKILDEMKKLTELMEDEDASVEDRYGTQMRLVDLEGELEKKLYALQEKYVKEMEKQGVPAFAGGPVSTEGQSDVLDLVASGGTSKVGDGMYHVTDRERGRILSYSDHAGFVDERTKLRKEAIQRVYMREHDPEAWAEYVEKTRKTYREKFEANQAMTDQYKSSSVGDVLQEMKTPESTGLVFPEKAPGGSMPDQTVFEVDPEQLLQTPPLDDVVMVGIPILDSAAYEEYLMEQAVQNSLAALLEEDYEELNDMRVSVMSAELAEESGDFLENLTNKLTEQFQKFAAVNELVAAEALADPTQEQDDQRMRKIADIASRVMDFLKKTILGSIQADATRGEGEDRYNYKIDKSNDPMHGVRDIFAPVEIAPREVWDYWQTLRPDLFQGGNAEA